MPLVERDVPLGQLLRWRDEALQGQGRLVFLGGEAGIGKTSVALALLRESKAIARCLSGACDPLSTPRPLAPLLDVAASLRGELARLLKQEAPVDAVGTSLLADVAACARPTVLLVEDARWADDATVDALRFIGRRIAPARLLLLVTYRDDEVGPRHPLRVAMGDMGSLPTVRRRNRNRVSS